MNQHITNTTAEQISQQELHHLITVATGFIDAYIIECHGKAAMLLPQNIVLSALDSSTQVKTVAWHEHQLPVFAVHQPNQRSGVALVIEGDEVSQRFALLCNEMPKSIRLRISEVVDHQQTSSDPTIFQFVKMQEQIFHVPNLQVIQQQLGL
jgi:hypothetical protein